MKDYYSDQGHNFIKLFASRELPEFVKEALDPSDIAQLPDGAFADVSNRRLPISTPGDVYVSASYYYGANDKNAEVESRLVKAAALFEITDEVEALKKDLTAEVKVASKNPSWAIDYSRETPKGTLTIRASGNDVESLGKTAESFISSYMDWEFEDRVKVAALICDQYPVVDAHPPFEVAAVAGRNIPDTSKVAQEIRSRAVRMESDQDKRDLLKIASEFESSTDKSMAGMMKLAQTLDEIDSKVGMARFYGKAFENPHLSVFNTDPVIAQKLAKVIEINGDEYSYTEVLQFSPEVLKLALGEDFDKVYDENGLDPEKVASLPDEQKKVLSSYL